MDTGSEDPAHQKIRAFVSISIVSVIALMLLYIVAVRTGFGQRFDDIAFEGRSVEDHEVTRELNDLLLWVTRSTLPLLTAALVVFALAQRRVRLAIAVGLAVTISVITTEILKTRVLSRPSLDDVAGIAQNSFPSGHATIGISSRVTRSHCCRDCAGIELHRGWARYRRLCRRLHRRVRDDSRAGVIHCHWIPPEAPRCVARLAASLEAVNASNRSVHLFDAICVN